MTITSDTVVLITGASSGIGRALALELARRGAKLALVARRSNLLEAVANECRALGGNALPIVRDVTDRRAFASAVEQSIGYFGHVDALVNNAGRGHHAYIEDTPDEHIESIFRVNVFSLWYGTSAVLPHMRARGNGLIVNISSIAGKVGFPANAAYVAAKHAVVGFSRALRAEVAETGIEVMTVIPAGTLTDWANVTEGGPMLELFEMENQGGITISEQRGVSRSHPIEVLPPEDVARAIVEAMENPRAEVYTHPGSRELALQAECDVEAFEREQNPFFIANRLAYERARTKQM